MTRALRALVLATLALLLVTACGSSDDGGSASSGGTVKLTFWTHTHPPMIDLNKKLVSEYEAKHPNVKISYEQIPNTEFATKMLTRSATAQGPT